MNRLVEPIFRRNRLSLRSHPLYSGQMRLLQGISGDTYGDTLYRTYMRLTAIDCEFIESNKVFTIINLCDVFRYGAIPCEGAKIGLKIRRSQGRGGSTPPPGTI